MHVEAHPGNVPNPKKNRWFLSLADRLWRMFLTFGKVMAKFLTRCTSQESARYFGLGKLGRCTHRGFKRFLTFRPVSCLHVGEAQVVKKHRVRIGLRGRFQM